MLSDIKNNSKKVDKFLKSYFRKQDFSNLISPMKYGTLDSGKKIRSSIILNTARIPRTKGDIEQFKSYQPKERI